MYEELYQFGQRFCCTGEYHGPAHGQLTLYGVGEALSNNKILIYLL